MSFAIIVYFYVLLVHVRIQISRLPIRSPPQWTPQTRSAVAREPDQHSHSCSQQSELPPDVSLPRVLGHCTSGTTSNFLPQHADHSLDPLACGLGYADRETKHVDQRVSGLKHLEVADLSIHFPAELYSICYARIASSCTCGPKA